MPHASVPAGDLRLIVAELFPTPGIELRELVEPSPLAQPLRIARFVTAPVELEPREPNRRAVARPLQIERKRATVERAIGIDTAAVGSVEETASPPRVGEHHQAPPGEQLDEAARLIRHVDVAGREPIDETRCGHPRTNEPAHVVVREGHAQRPATRSTARAAKVEVLGADQRQFASRGPFRHSRISLPTEGLRNKREPLQKA